MSVGDENVASPPAAQPRRAPGWLLPAALFAAAILLLFAPALAGDEQFLYRDAGRMHAPVKRWIASELAAGRLPSWNPYEAMGTSLVTDPIHAVQHPFNLLLLLLPFDVAFKAWILGCYLAATLGAYAWARRLGAGRVGATLAGLAFGLSGFLVGSSDNVTYLTTAAFVPWVLAAGHAFTAEGRWARLPGLMIASWVCAASGDPLAWAVAVGLVPLLGAALEPSRRRAALRLGFAAAACATLAAAPVILPLARGLAGSARGDAVDALARGLWNLHPLRLLEVAVPHLTSDPSLDTANEVLRVFAGTPGSYGPWVLSVYAGITVLILAASAGQHRTVRVLLGIAALFTWAAMGPHAGFGQLAQRLPVLASLRYWEKLFAWVTLLLAVSAGLGADGLVRGVLPQRRVVRIATGVTAVAALGALVSQLAPLEAWLAIAPDAGAAAAALSANLRQGTIHAAALAGVLAGTLHLLAARGRTDRIAPLLLLVVGADLVAANVRAYRLAAPTDRLPPSALRERLRAEAGLAGLVTPFYLAPDPTDGLAPWESKWRRGAQTLLPAWNVADRVRNASPYSALYSRRYARYEETVPLESRVAALGLYGFAFVAVPGEPALLARTALRPPWDIAARDPRYGTLLAVPHRPRAYLASAARTATEEEALSFASDPASVSSSLTLVEGPVPSRLAGGRAELVGDLPDAVRVRTETAAPGLLVLNDTFAPGWSATVDGRPAPILAANYLARGVPVEAGVHEVLFRYHPPLLAAGWAVALLALAGVVAAATFERRRRGGLAADMQTFPACKD